MATESERNIAYTAFNAFVLYVGGKNPPRDDEWDDYMRFERSGMTAGVVRRYLILTEGGSPTPRQQKVMHDQIQKTLAIAPSSLKAAIVTPSTFARGTGVALNQWSPIFKMFDPGQIAEAYAYLGIPPAYSNEVERLIQSLKATLKP